jgi:hypothetical protein
MSAVVNSSLRAKDIGSMRQACSELRSATDAVLQQLHARDCDDFHTLAALLHKLPALQLLCLDSEG